MDNNLEDTEVQRAKIGHETSECMLRHGWGVVHQIDVDFTKEGQSFLQGFWNRGRMGSERTIQVKLTEEGKCSPGI